MNHWDFRNFSSRIHLVRHFFSVVALRHLILPLERHLPEDPKRPTKGPRNIHPPPWGDALGCGTGKWEWGAWSLGLGGNLGGCYMKFGDLYTHGRGDFFFPLDFFFGLKNGCFNTGWLWVMSLFRVQHFCSLCIYRFSPSEALWEAFGIANWEGAWHPQFFGVNDMFSHVFRTKHRSPLLPKKECACGYPTQSTWFPHN